ncbi:hypothetical protein B0J12DRAFT_323809 [Macrophomina phaseolina]|uniref:Zn(2)-C6 fungal-type domain-containing protein n=1 Tax=Macrophomina phaseolina TaxID=35725 RepID=A0ABQ8FVR0_9PEZI|nr:hypothetical protein B0J12DRAFT_323809 [Macrophomina phaseolina]
MVGVPKSRGCATCRTRKIRQCDEQWPVCQQCRRSDRQCPGPSNPYGKFMDEGPRQRARGMAIRNSTPTERSEQGILVLCQPQHQEQLAQQTPCTNIETVRTKLTTSGAMFRTMKMVSDEPRDDEPPSSPPARKRASPKAHSAAPADARTKKQVQRQQAVFGGLPKQPRLSGVEILTSRLVASINEKGSSNQIRLFGPFIGEVPRRLGSTSALTDAAACLTTTHSNILRKTSRNRIDPRLYAKALQSLHSAIRDPLQATSTSTLCATVLLAITEAYAMGACGVNRNFTTHMGGAARILELRDPKDFQNPASFERALLRAVTVGVALNAVFSGKEDLLTSPEWSDIAFDTAGVAEPRATIA